MVENYIVRSLMITEYYSGDQIEKNEMGRACSMYGEEKRCKRGFRGNG